LVKLLDPTKLFVISELGIRSLFLVIFVEIKGENGYNMLESQKAIVGTLGAR
jgi:hypothetical protein